MKYTQTTSLFSCSFIRDVIVAGSCALLLIALQQEAVAQWTQASGIGNTSIGCLSASGDTILACGASKPDSIFISTSNGNSWMVADTNVPVIATAIVEMGTDFIVGSDRPGGSYYSTNFGNTWNSNMVDLPNAPFAGNGVYSLAVIGTTIFAAMAYGVFQQTAPGAAWTSDTIGMVPNGAFGPATVGSILVSGSNVYAGTDATGIFLSTNTGASWSQVNNGLPSSYFYGTIIDGFFSMGSTVYAVVADTNGITTGIYSTTTNGQSWIRMNNQPQNWGLGFGFVTSGQSLFAATDSGVYYSTNNGVDWIQANQGLPISTGNRPHVTSIDTSGGNLVVGTFSNGVWTRKLSDFAGASVSSNVSVPSGVSLTISENPASDAGTKIVYTLNNGGLTQVLLLDALGRTVRILQNGYASAGSNHISFDPLTVEPGTYFIRATSNGISAMQKLVITR